MCVSSLLYTLRRWANDYRCPSFGGSFLHALWHFLSASKFFLESLPSHLLLLKDRILLLLYSLSRTGFELSYSIGQLSRQQRVRRGYAPNAFLSLDIM